MNIYKPSNSLKADDLKPAQIAECRSEILMNTAEMMQLCYSNLNKLKESLKIAGLDSAAYYVSDYIAAAENLYREIYKDAAYLSGLGTDKIE